MKFFSKFTADLDAEQGVGAHGMRPAMGRLPSMSCDVFVATRPTRAAVEQMQASRHMSRVRCQVFNGGIDAALDFYEETDSPDLLIVEVGEDASTLFASLAALAEICRVETELVLVGPSNDITLYRALTRQGVADYLQTPVTAPLLITALFEMFRDPDKVNLGRVFAFISTRGGAGSSSVAHNIAWMMGGQTRSHAILADLDFEYGTAGLCLNRTPEQDLIGTISNTDKLDDQKLERLLIPYDDHLKLLAGPNLPKHQHNLEPEALGHAIDLLRLLSPYVVLDLPSTICPLTRKAMHLADEVILTATPDLASLRNTRSVIDILSTIRVGDKKPHLVLNQINQPKRPEIKPSDFINALNVNDPNLLYFDAAKYGAADNNGTLVAQHRRNRQQRNTFEKLAYTLTGAPPAKHSSSRFKPTKWLKRSRAG
ncbi:ParA-like protein [Thalassovita gelatinovora]|uniref:ParA-like protein n=1 Tax=Thalassovita gelatinovora TaxID=53501 RepID=A0A0P1F6R5_THAGE|nr:hypothetical protein [Thalassovita gelatinovora]QIZ79190.1 hypothetical protein HFZ77_01235 [Thalassovita gelatinovora]CUH63672.1 ParA-like protein [Thalassovita gelatinovora]SER01291.1 pilus assembly protein CpaE [Thalassovita gelatinovora]